MPRKVHYHKYMLELSVTWWLSVLIFCGFLGQCLAFARWKSAYLWSGSVRVCCLRTGQLAVCAAALLCADPTLFLGQIIAALCLPQVVA